MGCDGDILFLQPKPRGRFTRYGLFQAYWLTLKAAVWRRLWINGTVLYAGSRDEFFLAPEYQEHGIVTEKVDFSHSDITMFNVYLLFAAFHACLFCVSSGLCLRCCCYSLGYSQVPFVTQSKTGRSSQAEETSPGDGKEDRY